MHLTANKCKGRLLMKISLFAILLTAASTVMSYSTTAQHLHEIKASLPAGTLSLREALNHLEEHTDIRFTYRSSDINGFGRLHMAPDRSNVAVLLDALLKQTDLHYEQVGKTVIIKKNTAAATGRMKRVGTQAAISGQVLDETGAPLAGVTVRIAGTPVTTSTDAEGNFSIRATEANPVLTISYIGYQTVEVTANDLSDAAYTIRLQPDLGRLDEGTDIGYGTPSNRVRTGSTAGISSDEISQAPVNSPLAALQGRIAGLEVNTSNGLPGSAFTVRLRGLNSLGDANDPL